MKLTFEQIKSAINGIVRTEQNELGLELHRFTREQESFFYKTHPVFCYESFFNGYFGRNCRSCAGVTLDFISDAKTIMIEFSEIEYLKSKNPMPQKFDLYIDDEYVRSYDVDKEIIYETLGNEQRFTLYFPYCAFPIISSVQLENATVFYPQKKQVDILFLGDSITHGARAVKPSNTYVMRIARSMHVCILNQGNSGFVYDAGSIEKVCEPKIVITAYGINDFMKKNLQMIEQDTTEFIKKLKSVYQNSKIVSILPVWTMWDGADKNFKKEERQCLKNIYEKYCDCVVDGLELIPHDEKYFTDGVHPNDEGLKFYAENLIPTLTSIIG